MTCNQCHSSRPKDIKGGRCTPPVIEIKNPPEVVIFHRVDVPASMGDETEYPPEAGLYKNVLLVYEVNNHAYLYSSDGIPTNVTIAGPQGPQGEPGKDGENGADGRDGTDGRDGVIQYTAGTGIDITNNVISATVVSTTAWGDITGTLSDQTDLDNALGDKADASDVGDLSTLVTADQSSLVAAVNEVSSVADGADTKAEDVDQRLTDLFTFTYRSLDDATNPLTISCSPSAALDTSGTRLTCAVNSDGSLAKIYGRIRLNANNGECTCTVGNTGLPTLDSPITIAGCMLRIAKYSSGSSMTFTSEYTINTDGTITIPIGNSTTFTGGVDGILIACLIVVKDFGDTPEP